MRVRTTTTTTEKLRVEFLFCCCRWIKKIRPRQKAKSDQKIFRERGGAAKLAVDTSHALIRHGLTFVKHLNAEMEGCPVWHIVRDKWRELLYYLFHV